MRFALWSIVLAAVAVGIAIFARHSTGFVVIVSAPWRIELSLNLLVFLVLAGYLAFYTLARLISTLAAIPARVRAYRGERQRSRLRQSLNDALLAFFQGTVWFLLLLASYLFFADFKSCSLETFRYTN